MLVELMTLIEFMKPQVPNTVNPMHWIRVVKWATLSEVEGQGGLETNHGRKKWYHRQARHGPMQKGKVPMAVSKYTIKVVLFIKF